MRPDFSCEREQNWYSELSVQARVKALDIKDVYPEHKQRDLDTNKKEILSPLQETDGICTITVVCVSEK